MALFPGPPRWASARRELLDFMVQGKINRGRHTDHPAGRHSIRTNQCPPPPSSPYFFTSRMPFLLPNQQHHSTEGNQSIEVLFQNKRRKKPRRNQQGSQGKQPLEQRWWRQWTHSPVSGVSDVTQHALSVFLGVRLIILAVCTSTKPRQTIN